MLVFKKSYHRELLEKLLKKHAHLMRGEILDIGSKNRRYDHLLKGQITAVDLVPDPNQDVAFGDVEKGLEFPDQKFDGIICLEVFEYLDDYEHAISEIYRLLKPGGYGLITIPFMYADHEDRIRFTQSFIESKFAQFEKIEIIRIGTGFTIIWDIWRSRVRLLNNVILRYAGFTTLAMYSLLIKLLKLQDYRDLKFYSGLFIIVTRK